jgi:hypothetical protein
MGCQLYPSASPKTPPLTSKFGVMSPVAAVCLLWPVESPMEVPKNGPFQLYGAGGISGGNAARGDPSMA